MKKTLYRICVCAAFMSRDSNPPSFISTQSKNFWTQESQLWRTGAGFQVGLQDTGGHLPRFPLGAG